MKNFQLLEFLISWFKSYVLFWCIRAHTNDKIINFNISTSFIGGCLILVNNQGIYQSELELELELELKLELN